MTPMPGIVPEHDMSPCVKVVMTFSFRDLCLEQSLLPATDQLPRQQIPDGQSVPVDVHHRLSELLWRFLRQIVTDSALDKPVCVLAREFSGIRFRFRVRCTVGIAFES